MSANKLDKSHQQSLDDTGNMHHDARRARGHWAFAGYLAQQRLLSLMSACLMRVRLAWWLVEGGADAQFFGLTRICRHPTGTILLGRRLVFRSAPSSNSIGLKQRCFLSAARGATLRVGDDCGFSATVIAASQHIQIGHRVLCGANVTICDSDRHPLVAQQRELPAAEQARCIQTAPIYIEDDVFIGMNALILKGITIGTGAVVAANAVVTKSVPAGAIVAGIPAQIVGYTASIANHIKADNTIVPRQHVGEHTDDGVADIAQPHTQGHVTL